MDDKYNYFKIPLDLNHNLVMVSCTNFPIIISINSIKNKLNNKFGINLFTDKINNEKIFITKDKRGCIKLESYFTKCGVLTTTIPKISSVHDIRIWIWICNDCFEKDYFGNTPVVKWN